ncbi:hypothetical protein ACFOEE_06815 [Pseudoalteromonas fenneropenaei]|uniref:Phage shock protein B n=1 Tax=Pseudoalteromonas fenneropenaei TaxID=1737459 RepID=A0ABV7CHY9_9GAMM
MAGTTMVFLIVAICVISGVFGEVLKRFIEYKKLQQNQNFNAAGNEQLNKEIAELKARVQVLEQIVTDEGYQVKQQFKSL